MAFELSTCLVTEPPDRISREIVVVGSGPGGSVAASLLANAGRDVLVLEEGPFLPASSCRPYTRAELEQKYRNGGVTFALGRPKVTYVEARCAGGGSEVNAGIYCRTPDETLARWATEYGVRELDPADMAPHFETMEKELGVSSSSRPLSAAAAKLRDGAEKLSFRSQTVRSSLRSSPCESDPSRETERGSMLQTVLASALRTGAQLLADTRVDSLRRVGGRWRLRCRHTPLGAPPREIEVMAGQVFLGCGAIQTPALLRRSGIRRNIGNSLQMHATLKVTARFPDEVNFPNMGVPTWEVDEFAPRFCFTCAISSPAYLALELLQYPDHFQEVARSWRQMAIYSARISGGRGVVRNLPGYLDPIVRFRLSADDMRDLSEATTQLCSCLLAAGAEVVYPSILLGSPLRSRRDLERLPSRLPRELTNLMTIHLFSSCPMGEDETRCATDSFGKVHGVDDLYITDASMLCTAPRVNPQGTIMALARRNLLQILTSARPRVPTRRVEGWRGETTGLGADAA
jgi:choline dehydrogenase-like flavoprotein